MNLFDFTYCGNYNRQIQNLARMVPEKWSFGESNDNGILKGYLEYTFKRVYEEKKVIKSYSFLTQKPIIYLANIKESELGNPDNIYVEKVKKYASQENARVVSWSAKVEEDLSELSKDEKQEMLDALGIDGSGLDKLITATYDILGLATYFTVGRDEVRAWTFKKGMNAKQCAGIIHTDFEKGFIRAEVMSYEDLIECGSELKVKESGKARLEGKEYLMQDGDICHFRFNV